MNDKRLEIKTEIQIRKTTDEVFEAIVDPGKMSNYFISESTGSIEEGKTLNWKFPEFDIVFPVRIGMIEKDRYISYYWNGEDGKELFVEIFLKPFDVNSTIVTVTEKSMENNEAGLKWLMNNSAGWANFLACLKAYIEHGINLRKGSFDFMKGKY